MSQYTGLLIKKRDASTFSPSDRAADLRLWIEVDRSLVTSSGNFASLTDLNGSGHNGVIATGAFNLPTIVSPDSDLGNKTSLAFTRDGVGQPLQFAGVNLNPPWTMYLVMYMGSGVHLHQQILQGLTTAIGNYPNIYTYDGGPPDSLVMSGSNQLLSGVVLANSACILVLQANTSGNLSGVSKSSETLDSSANLGGIGAQGFSLFADRTSSAANQAGAKFAALFLTGTLDTKSQIRDFLNYGQAKWGVLPDYDAQGVLYREKFSVNVGANPSSYPVRALAPMQTPNGALRLYTRYTPTTPNNGHSGELEWSQHNSGAGPELRRGLDGILTLVTGGTSYATEFGVSVDTTHDCEIFAAIGGGAIPELAWRTDGPSGAWFSLPIPGATTIAALSFTGNVNLGGDASGTSLLGTFKEATAYTDGAKPAGYSIPTYPAGVLTIIGGAQGTALECGGWPTLAIGALTKACPMPRMPGTNAAASYESLNTALSTWTSLVVSGSTLNIAVITSGGYGSIALNSDSAATAYAALQTLCTNLRSGGYNKIVVTTNTPAYGFTDATRLSLNTMITSSLVSGGYADAVVDWASNASIGGTGASSSSTYFTSDQRGWTLAAGRIGAAMAATTLNALLP